VFASSARLDPVVREAYLARLGVDAGPPSVAGLRLLTQRQVERMPYETMSIHAGEGWDLDPSEAAARIALHGRAERGAQAPYLRGFGPVSPAIHPRLPCL
jgi:hypothetical protein